MVQYARLVPAANCAYSRRAARTSSASPRDLEARGRAWAIITRGLCSVAEFYRNAVLRHEAPVTERR